MTTQSAFCKFPWTRLKVQCNGDMNMCCHQGFHILGNMMESSWEELWFSDKAQEIRRHVQNKQLDSYCNTNECPFKYVKSLSEYEFSVNSNGFPVELEFDMHASWCNFGGTKADPRSTCIMCPRSEAGTRQLLQTQPDITKQLAEKLKPLMAHLHNLCVLGLAEPFWKGKLFEILDIFDFKDYQDRIHFWTNTNGSVFNRKMMRRYVEYVRDGCLHFSLDATTAETFLKIRRNNVFNRILDNLREWNEFRLKLNQQGHKHMLKISNNINLLNVHEVPDMVRMAADIGVDQLILSPTHDMSGLNVAIKDIVPNHSNFKDFQFAESEARRLAEELNVNLYITRPLDCGFEQKLYNITLI